MIGSAFLSAFHLLFLFTPISAWISSSTKAISLLPRASTPFEVDLYDNQYDDDASSALPSDTRLVIGLNKYSHDTSLCAADAKTGNVLFALSKERLTRRKHDAGNVAGLVESCLEELGLGLENIERVVCNNHHHRVLSMESNLRHMEWESGLRINGGAEDGYDEPENVLEADFRELSHHLAHAYSTAAQATFYSGMCVVMDGMGETFRTMKAGIDDPSYTSDLEFGIDSFQCVPSDIVERTANSVFDWREAESVYVFTKTENSIDLRPVFKRFTPENSPPTLYNHGFENMDSLGALYSRVSSHVFGDWNACGKVMGLAPWAGYAWTDALGGKLVAPTIKSPIIKGHVYLEDDEKKLIFNRTALEGMPLIARNGPDLFESDGSKKKLYDFDDNDGDTDSETRPRPPLSVALDAIALAHRIQTDLETVAIDFVRHFKEKTGQSNLCLAGGVALNSVLNGRLARELGFEQTFITPYPGDDGIAVGCCAFGLFGNTHLDTADEKRPPIWKKPFAPYLGPDPSEEEIRDALVAAVPWLEVEAVRDEDVRLTTMAEELENGTVIAWYRSRSEMGPRALGHRSILADPRKKGLVRFINEHVKSRESFRPFAPSVLAEEAHQWFEFGNNVEAGNLSPYMSMTVTVQNDKRSEIPAVTHVDGSSRLQTVTKEAEPVYHKLISKFSELTGVPMVLNTSFNTLPGEPIVESPADAIRSFLFSAGAIEVLIMGDYVIRRKSADLRMLLGEATRDGKVTGQQACPKRAGAVRFETTFNLEAQKFEDEVIETRIRVCMPDRPTHGNKNDWVGLLDELEGEILSVCDGTVTLNEIMAEYLPADGANVDEDKIDEAQNLLQNIIHRMVRLFDLTLIGW